MRIAIVNDMMMAVEALRRVLATVPQYQIAWIARDGEEAVQLCAQDKPDLILMDLVMPRVDGVDATRRIMAASPCAILMVTGAMDSNVGKVFEALGAGALDAVKTPVLGTTGASAESSALLYKINTISKLVNDSEKSLPDKEPVEKRTVASGDASSLVGLGASAGGPVALAGILSRIPKGFPAAIVIIQHVDAQFAGGLAQWLGSQSTVPVAIASTGDRPQAGRVYMAGTDDHLVLSSEGRLIYTADPEDYPYRPSVDTFFHSIVRHWSGEAAGVLLTGMGRDGARGLKALRDAGFHTIAQDQATSAVYGMPKAAANLQAAVETLPLQRIAPALIQRFCAQPARLNRL